MFEEVFGFVFLLIYLLCFFFVLIESFLFEKESSIFNYIFFLFGVMLIFRFFVRIEGEKGLIILIVYWRMDGLIIVSLLF